MPEPTLKVTMPGPGQPRRQLDRVIEAMRVAQAELLVDADAALAALDAGLSEVGAHPDGDRPWSCPTCGATNPADLRELEHWEGPDEEDCIRFPCPDSFHRR